MTRLCCHRFGANEARLWLSGIASNLRNLCRLALQHGLGMWSLTRLQRLVKTGGRLQAAVAWRNCAGSNGTYTL
jgi:hypothetical protein